ncbi:MAG: hypothetical protein LBQ93_05815 [Treponema sp.]|jgi:hypothetical protein|nr:hypothetical protein [Treponema sp.]
MNLSGGSKMKWTNKGHEFDKLGKIFETNKKLCIICSPEEKESLRRKIDFLGTEICFVNNISFVLLFNLLFVNFDSIKDFQAKTVVFSVKRYNSYRLLKKLLRIISPPPPNPIF